MLGESDLARWVVTFVWAVVTGIGVPWLGMRMLFPVIISSAPAVKNHRGRDVHTGLGLVWLFWLLGAGMFLSGMTVLAWLWRLPELVLVGSPLDLGLLLVGAAFVFGLVDDVFGTHAEKGFRGHLAALARGKLTTGGLKLLGIGAVSLFAGAQVSLVGGVTSATAAHGIAVAALLALSSNAFNLFDLRPGRALKAYAVLVVIGLVATAIGLARSGIASPALVGDLAVVAAFSLGPALAVARFDLGEIGMLGDAGANGLGMWAGVILVAALPPLATGIVAALLLGLNLASERVSFSLVIEKNRVLSAIDGWGRMMQDECVGEGVE